MRIGKNLESAILQNYYSYEHRLSMKQGYTLPASVADAMYEELFGRYAHIFAQCPAGFLAEADAFVVDRAVFAGINSYIGIRFPLSKFRPFPAAGFKCPEAMIAMGDSSQGPRIQFYEYVPKSADTERFMKHLHDLAAKGQRTLRKAVLIRTLIGKCKSVEALLSVAPALGTLLPKDIEARVKERKRRYPVKVDIQKDQLDRLQADLTALKILGIRNEPF